MTMKIRSIFLGSALLLLISVGHAQTPKTGLAPASIVGAPRVKLWRPASDKAITALAVAPSRVLVATGEATLELFAPDGTPQKSVEIRDGDGFRWPAYAAAISADGKRALTANIDLNARLLDLETGAIISGFNGGDVVRVTAIALSTDEVAVGTAFSLAVFETQGRRRISGFKVPTNGVGSLAFSPDGALLAVGLEDRSVRLFDAQTGAEIARLGAHEGAVRALAWSGDGTRLASGGRDGSVKVWDVAAKTELMSFVGESGAIESLAFYAKPNVLAVGLSPIGGEASNKTSEPQLQPAVPVATAQKVVELWDIGGAAPILKRQVSDVYGARQVAFSPDGRALLVGYANGSLKEHDLGSMPLAPKTVVAKDAAPTAALPFDANGLRQLNGLSSGTLALAASAQQIAGGGKDGVVAVWDARSGRLLGRRGEHNLAISSLAWSPDGQKIASGGEDDLEVSDAKTTLWKAPGRAVVAGWSSDGKTLFAFIKDQGNSNLYGFDAQTGAHGESLGNLPYPFVAGLSFDGQTIIAGAYSAPNRQNAYSAFSALYYFNAQKPARQTQSANVKGYIGALALEKLPDGDTRAFTDDGDIHDHFDDDSKPVAVSLGWHSFALKSQNETSDMSFDQPVVALAKASDGRLAVGLERVGRKPATVRLFDVKGKLSASWTGQQLENEIESLAFSGDGKTVIIGLSNRAPFEWTGKTTVGASSHAADDN